MVIVSFSFVFYLNYLSSLQLQTNLLPTFFRCAHLISITFTTALLFLLFIVHFYLLYFSYVPTTPFYVLYTSPAFLLNYIESNNCYFHLLPHIRPPILYSILIIRRAPFSTLLINAWRVGIFPNPSSVYTIYYFSFSFKHPVLAAAPDIQHPFSRISPVKNPPKPPFSLKKTPKPLFFLIFHNSYKPRKTP